MSSSIHLSYCHAPKLLISKKLMMSDEGKNLKLSLLLAHKEEVHTHLNHRVRMCAICTRKETTILAILGRLSVVITLRDQTNDEGAAEERGSFHYS